MEEEPASSTTTTTTTSSSSSASSRYSSANVSPPGNPLPPEGPTQPMEFLARSWSLSALEVCKAIGPSPPTSSTTKTSINLPAGIPEDDIVVVEQLEQSGSGVPANGLAGNPFSFATAVTSQLVLERIMSQSVAHSQQQQQTQQQNQQEISPRTSGRLSHSSGPLNAQSCGGSFSDSPPLSPSDMDELKFCRLSNTVQSHYRGKTVGRWLKDRREKKKQDTRTHNAQLHAAISVAGVAAAVAAIAAATAGSSKDEQARIDLAVVSAATLVAAQCVEAAESLGADREVLMSVVNSAVNVRNAGDIMTLNAAAATALRGAATLKARANKDVWNIAAVIPVEKGLISNNNPKHQASPLSGDLPPEDDFLGVCSQELVSRGGELLKRTRKGDLHWKLVSVYINRFGQVMVKMKSRHVAGTITKNKKNVILDVCKDIPAWPGRHLLEGGEYRRYFGLRTADRGVIEFECRNEREYEIWTKGVSRLLAIAREKKRRPLLI